MDINKIIRNQRTQHQWSWYKTLTSGKGLDGIYNLASLFNGGRHCKRGYDEFGAWVRKGGYNMSFWVEFDDGTKRVIRFPMVGAIAQELVDEKLKIEIATMMFVSTETTIPIPKLIGYGLTGNTHHLNGLPFLILTHVPGKPLGGVWDELDEVAKVKIYDQMADITIQLRSHPFDRIGSLTVDDRGQWSLSNRPLGRPLASLQRDGIDIRMAQSYSASLDYFIDYFCHYR